MPIISVLVTFCNQEKYIRQTLDSILKQKIDCNYEVLVGLDGKKEKSIEILNEYRKKYNFIHIYEIDYSNRYCINIEKASANRYNLLKHAKGKYFCILDGDDCYGSEDQFKVQLATLKQNPDCIGCAVGQIFVYSQQEKNLSYPKQSFYTLEEYIKSGIYIHNGAIMFKNIFLQGFPKDFPEKILNDITMTMYMMKFGKITYIPLSSYRYTISDSGIYQGASSLIKNLYGVLDAEINLQYIAQYRTCLLKKYKKRLKKLYRNRKKYTFPSEEINKILIFAKENNCRLLKAVLSYGRSSSCFERFWWSLIGKLLLITKCYSSKKNIS